LLLALGQIHQVLCELAMVNHRWEKTIHASFVGVEISKSGQFEIIYTPSQNQILREGVPYRIVLDFMSPEALHESKPEGSIPGQVGEAVRFYQCGCGPCFACGTFMFVDALGCICPNCGRKPEDAGPDSPKA
jgi:hypothetical protein